MTQTKPITVIVVDDSALVRKMLTEILNTDSDIEVVATAADPYQARDKIKRFNPDVLTLDIEMPRMDGLTFLRNLMRLRPMPVVMISSLTEQGAEVTLEALELGAVDFLPKPKIDLSHSLQEYAEDIVTKVKTAAAVPLAALEMRLVEQQRWSTDAVLAKATVTNTTLRTTEKIVAIGASTGGTEAIKTVLSGLPATAPGMVITQHIPGAFSAAFAKRLNGLTAMQVKQAEEGEQILPGHVYIAPGDRHLLVQRRGARYYVSLNDGVAVSRHKPSVDVLFRSVAQQVGANAIGVMLTGMGNDGAEGMQEMKQAGARTMAQDEKTSVVWGMPGVVAKNGAAEKVLPLQDIAREIMTLVNTNMAL